MKDAESRAFIARALEHLTARRAHAIGAAMEMAFADSHPDLHGMERAVARQNHAPYVGALTELVGVARRHGACTIHDLWVRNASLVIQEAQVLLEDDQR